MVSGWRRAVLVLFSGDWLVSQGSLVLRVTLYGKVMDMRYDLRVTMRQRRKRKGSIEGCREREDHFTFLLKDRRSWKI